MHAGEQLARPGNGRDPRFEGQAFALVQAADEAATRRRPLFVDGARARLRERGARLIEPARIGEQTQAPLRWDLATFEHDAAEERSVATETARTAQLVHP